jgi:archaellum biogenesis ATPase FlaH
MFGPSSESRWLILFCMQGLWFLPSLIFGAVQGFTSGSWQMLLFAVVSLSIWPLGRWLQHSRNFALDGQVSFDGKDVWIGGHRLPRREVFWRHDWHATVWAGLVAQEAELSLPSVLAAAAARGFRGSTAESNWIGVDGGHGFELDLAKSGPHLLIIGATGTGKSELLRLLVSGWLNQEADLELTLIDFKGGATMVPFANHPRVVGLATDLELTDVVAIAATLERQLMRRQEQLAESGMSSIEEYCRSGRTLKRHFIVVDELGELLRQHPRLSQALEQIAARGRSLGMHLVIANQSMSGVSRNLLVNLRARVAIGEMDPIDLSQLGFRSRGLPRTLGAKWSPAKLRTGDGFELEFAFPIGF